MVAVAGAVPRVLLDRYELRELAGRGGMGEVWLGWDRRLQRDVAVKLLLPELAVDPSFRERFAQEARSGTLGHPNVVDVYDVDQDGDTPFIVMERLPGPSLDLRLNQGPMSDDEVRRLAADMLAGLGAAHQEGIIHRDIKPGNLIRSAGGRWKVGDFGVAKDLSSTAALTLVGVPVGTPAYLAPEQLAGQPATPATDLWAAAIVLREALTGHRPFPGDDPIAVAHAVRHVPLPPMATVRPDIDVHLAGAIDRALSADPADRFPSAGAMLAALEGRPQSIPPSPVPAPTVEPGGEPAPVAPPSVAAAVPPDAPPAPPPVMVHRDGTVGPERRSTAVRVAAVTVIALGVLALLFLMGVVLGLLMVDGGNDGPDGQPVPTSSPGASPSPSTTTSAAGATDTTADEGVVQPMPSEPDGNSPTTKPPEGAVPNDDGVRGGGSDGSTTTSIPS